MLEHWHGTNDQLNEQLKHCGRERRRSACAGPIVIDDVACAIAGVGMCSASNFDHGSHVRAVCAGLWDSSATGAAALFDGPFVGR